MHQEIMYPVCPHRNVAAAFQRFLGPDSGGIERFFPDERARRVDGTLLIVRLRGRRAVSGAVHELQRAARAASEAIGAFNSVLFVLAWIAAASGRAFIAKLLSSGMLFGSRPVRLPV
jgi:hypothetical protein